jgi:nitric oxide dioxygenase
VIAATAAVVAEHAEEITARFYPRMFAERPELLRVFNMGNQATGEQSRALAASVVAYAVQLIDPAAPSFAHVMTRIAHKHVSLGVRPEQYTIVGHHLLAAVAEVLGDAVTPPVAEAWSEVYWLFATQLIAEEARLYAGAGVDPATPTRPFRVVRRIEETDDVVSLVLEPADDAPVPDIEPGQYVSLFVDLPGGDRQPRQYTVSSTAVGTRLMVTVRKVRGADGAPDGRVSSFLHDQSRSGTSSTSALRPATSSSRPRTRRCCSPPPAPGITTVLPIVEHIARTQPQRPVIVAHADRTSKDHALRETVLHAGRQLDDFTRYTWYETVEADDHRSRTGFMDLSEIPLPAGLHVFTCGPLPFMRQVRSALLARQIPADHIRYEVFGPDLWEAAPPVADRDAGRDGACLRRRLRLRGGCRGCADAQHPPVGRGLGGRAGGVRGPSSTRTSRIRAGVRRTRPCTRSCARTSGWRARTGCCCA